MPEIPTLEELFRTLPHSEGCEGTDDEQDDGTCGCFRMALPLLSDLRATAQAGIDDRERLDWLEGCGCVEAWVPQPTTPTPSELRLRWSLDDAYSNDETLRAAIDAARSQEGKHMSDVNRYTHEKENAE